MAEPALVIGWDGAPYENISQWLSAGELPNLRAIAEDGYFGPLETTPYVMSPCAWSTFLTGQNAGSHGVYDFYANDFRDGEYFREPIDASARRAPELWHVFNDQDKRVGVINVPVTYPVDEVDGFMVSGVLSPSPNDSNFVHPRGFLSEFDSLNDYLIDLDMSKNDDKDEFLERIDEMVERRTELIRYCIENSSDIDVLVAVYTSPDRLSHYFWHFQDESHPNRATESEDVLAAYQDTILDLFRKLDRELGEVVDTFKHKYGGDVNVAVISDHGMDSLKTLFLVNEWLERQGYLTFKDDPEEVDEDELPSEKEYVFGQVDWERTQAYSIGKAGEIYINLEGREPMGCVAPDEYEVVRKSIANDLQDVTDPWNGATIVDSVTPREALLEGEYVDRAPDLFVNLTNGNYSLGYLYEGNVFLRNQSTELPFVTGIENGPGIICQSGPAFRSDEFKVEMGLVDYLPTLLHALGLEVPADMDGRVVEELLTDRHREVHGVTYREGRQKPSVGNETDEKASEDVKERLKDLGYY